ncbi:hypothetical protein M569_15114, partial [Genlisea aurea]
EEDDGAKVVRVENLNNPYIAEPASKSRFKLTLNKLYAWKLVEYERVVMLDADNLFLHRTDELFQCGQFCAVFINPCIFHTGLFVLQPSMEVFNDMMHQLETGKSNPDGADQGFIGGYFPDLLDRPVFHPPPPSPNGTIARLNGHYRLPLGYQMDATYYYLRLRWNVPCGPNSVITFPGAPWLKPWYWWSWPVLPLGIDWHSQRRRTLGYEAEMPVVFMQAIFYIGVMAMTRFARPNLSKLCYRRDDKSGSVFFVQTGFKLVAVWYIGAAYVVPFLIIPHTVHPVVGWTLYLLGSFSLASVAVNAFLLPTLPVAAPGILIAGVLVTMAYPWYNDGVVRALSIFGYGFCSAPVLWVACSRILSSLHVCLEREAFMPSSLPLGCNKWY